MKKIITVFSIALGLLSVGACDKFLNVNPEGNPTTTTYFTNDQQAIDAVDYLYARFHQEAMFGREIFWEQGGANQVVWGKTRGYSTLATLDYKGSESPLEGNFKQCYGGMANANFVIKKLNEKAAANDLTAIETRSLGEAYFMRAFYHFYIAYRYGTKDQGVPFIRWEDSNGDYDNSIPPQLASVADNYGFIISDLAKAEELLPTFEQYGAADRGRAHKAAAVGYMAKTYAYWATWDKSQWDNVITCVNKLETTYGRDLAPSFSQLFSCEFDDFWTKEYLWSIPGNGGANGGGSEFPGVCLENKGWGIYNGWGQHKPSYDTYEEMAKDNVGGVKNERLVRTVLEYGDKFMFNGEERRFYSSSDVESGFMINKWMAPFGKADMTSAGYVNTNGDWPTARVNFHILRFADCLLLRAEAYINKNEEGKALTDINRVRTRSNLTPATSANMAQIYHERFCELAFEPADHLADVKRWAVSGASDVKALAIAELTTHPKARHYADRENPESTYTVGDYEDYKSQKVWDDHKVVFPYPTTQITLSAGKLKQNAGY